MFVVVVVFIVVIVIIVMFVMFIVCVGVVGVVFVIGFGLGLGLDVVDRRRRRKRAELGAKETGAPWCSSLTAVRCRVLAGSKDRGHTPMLPVTLIMFIAVRVRFWDSDLSVARGRQSSRLREGRRNRGVGERVVGGRGVGTKSGFDYQNLGPDEFARRLIVFDAP